MDTALAETEPDQPSFEVSYLDASGNRQRRSLLSCATHRFEDSPPVRRFRWSRGERHFPGWYWAATLHRHVGYESWLERDRLMLLDLDPLVTGISSQPFWLSWHDGQRERRHAPDYFVRRADGSAAVVDIRDDDRIRPRDVRIFEATRVACAQAGWGFERLGKPGPVLMANVRWLSRYRHPRCLRKDIAARLREAFTSPAPLYSGASTAGETLAVLPVLYHLIWKHELVVDLAFELMGPDTLVSPASGTLR